MPSTSTDRRQGVNSGAAIKVPCVVATTANITLSGTQTIDGVAVVADDRVLVKNQTTGSENGIWVASSGSWTRALDFDGTYDVVTGTMVKVNGGTTTSGFWYITTTGTITVGTTSIAFGQASTILAVVTAFMQTVLSAATSLVAKSTLKVADPPTNLVPNSTLGICSALPLARVGTLISITNWSDVGVNQGNVQINSADSISGRANGIVAGKLFLVEGAGTPRAANVGVTGTVTGTTRITCAAATFTGVEVGDVADLTGGTNTSPKGKYRVSATDASTYVELIGFGDTILVDETATYSITWYEGSKDVNSTINGMAAGGDSSFASAIGYPLMATEMNAGSFQATLAGYVLASAGGGAAIGWEVTPGDEYGVSGNAADGWYKDATLRYWRTFDKDWDGTTAVTQDGSPYGCKLKKGTSGTELFYTNLTEHIPTDQNAASETELLEKFKGKTIAFGMFWMPPGASKARPFIYDGVTYTYGDYFTASSFTWEEVTATISASATTVKCGISLTGATGDIHYGTQPMGLFGSEIGEGNYVPSNGIHVFTAHPNFPQGYINRTITTSAVIRIEQESLGMLPRGIKALHGQVEGQNSTFPNLSGTASLNTGLGLYESANVRLPCMTLYDNYGTAAMLFSCGATAVGAGATAYVGVGFVSTTEGEVQLRVPFACKVAKFYVQSQTSPVGAETYTFTLRKNNADTALTCFMTGTGTTAEDTELSHTVTFTAGDKISIKVVTSAGAAASKFMGAIEVYKSAHTLATNAGLLVIGKKTEASPSTWRSDCLYIGVGGSPNSGWNSLNIDMVACELGG